MSTNDQRSTFLPTARAFRRAMKEAAVWVAAMHVFGTAILFIPQAFWPLVLVTAVCFVLALRAALRCNRVLCPSCDKNILWAGFHCPVCTTPIDHSEGVLGPTCAGCQTCVRIISYDQRKYRVRFCPHCTAFLSDEGL